MVGTVRNPTEGIYPATDDYIHEMEVMGPGRTLYVAGTMGLAPNGAAPGSIDEQLELLWSNIRTILASARMTTDHIIRLTSYLADESYADANARARLMALGRRRVPTAAIICKLLSPQWKVEIEVIAFDAG